MPGSRVVTQVLLLLATAPVVAQEAGVDRFGVALPSKAVMRLEAAHLRENLLARKGDPHGLYYLAVDRDGIAVSGNNNPGAPVRFWNLATGEELARSGTPIPMGDFVTISPDGKTVLVTSRKWPTKAYDRDTAKLRFEIDFKDEHAGLAEFAPDGKTFAALTYEGSLAIWDANGKLLRKQQLDEPGARALAHSPDGRILAVGFQEGALRLVRVDSGAEVRRWQAHERMVMSCAWQPDGKVLASYGYDSKVRFWDPETGKETGKPIAGYGYHLRYSPDRSVFAVGYSGLHLYDTKTGGKLFTSRGHHSPVEGMAFAPDSKAVFWCDRGGHPKMARRDGDKFIEVEPERLLALALVFNPDGKQLVTAGDKYVRVWETSTGRERRRLPEKLGRVTDLALTADGKTLALAAGRTIRVCDSASGETRQTLTVAAGKVVRVRFNHAGTLLAACYDKAIALWDARGADKPGLQERTTLKGHTARVSDIALARDGKLLVSASEDRTLRLWDVASGMERGLIGPLDSPVACVALAADGKHLAAGDWHGTIRVWEIVADGARVKLREVRVLKGHEDNVSALAFSPESGLLASGSWDRSVRLWDVKTGAQREVYHGHRDEVTSLAFGPDGRRLASGSRDDTVLIWDVAAKP